MSKLEELLARLRKNPLRVLTVLLVAIAAIPRLWTMWFDQGEFWPDEIYQSIEQAHRLAFGYGFIPWEFVKGVRSWVFPGILAAVLKLASLLGAHSGEALVKTAKTFMVVLALWAVVSSMQLGRRIGGIWGALFAGIASALFPASIVYGSRCMSELASCPLLCTAAVLALDGGKKRVLWAGALAGTAIYVRYQNGLLTAAFLVMLLASKRYRDALWYALSAGAFGLAGGLLDWITWGKPFGAFLGYYQFNVVEGKASQWGTADAMYYFQCIWNSTGPWAVALLAVGFVCSFARTRVLPLAIVAYMWGHILIPHKEYRFLMPPIPLVLDLAGGGLGWLVERASQWKRGEDAARAATEIGWAATAAAVLLGTSLTHKLFTITFGDMGSFQDSPMGKNPPWFHEEGPNLAFWEAGKDPELCGIIMVGIPIIATGVYSYLHREVPIITRMDTGAANYLAAPALMQPPHGYRLVKSFRKDDYALFKRPGTCSPPPPWFSYVIN